MPVEVSVYLLPAHTRSKIVTQAMMSGIRRAGDRPRLKPAAAFEPNDGIAAFYGLTGKLARAIQAQKAAGGTAVYIDLGYWGRREGGRWSGYHKVSVNSRHPTAYFQARQHGPERFARFGLTPAPWQDGRHILIAGMGDKGAKAEGGAPGEWERAAAKALKEVTDRPIVYRPKPSWKGATPLDGVIFSPSTQRIDDVLAGCHAVVTHHSNVAVDALMMGIPVFCWEGVGTPLALQDLTQIENPWRPDDRLRWACDVSFCQWSIREMADGLAWRHLKDEGLLGC